MRARVDWQVAPMACPTLRRKVRRILLCVYYFPPLIVWIVLILPVAALGHALGLVQMGLDWIIDRHMRFAVKIAGEFDRRWR